jgi:hypothetical protein
LLGREEEGVDSRDGKIAQGRHLAPNVASVAVAVESSLLGQPMPFSPQQQIFHQRRSFPRAQSWRHCVLICSKYQHTAHDTTPHDTTKTRVPVRVVRASRGVLKAQLKAV